MKRIITTGIAIMLSLTIVIAEEVRTHKIEVNFDMEENHIKDIDYLEFKRAYDDQGIGIIHGARIECYSYNPGEDPLTECNLIDHTGYSIFKLNSGDGPEIPIMQVESANIPKIWGKIDIIDSENLGESGLSIESLGGIGNAYACFGSNGELFRSKSPCTLHIKNDGDIRGA